VNDDAYNTWQTIMKTP